MNGMGLSLSEICCLFCCPPCPSKIAAKLAFLPPEPTYTFEVSSFETHLHLMSAVGPRCCAVLTIALMQWILWVWFPYIPPGPTESCLVNGGLSDLGNKQKLENAAQQTCHGKCIASPGKLRHHSCGRRNNIQPADQCDSNQC